MSMNEKEEQKYKDILTKGVRIYETSAIKDALNNDVVHMHEMRRNSVTGAREQISICIPSSEILESQPNHCLKPCIDQLRLRLYNNNQVPTVLQVKMLTRIPITDENDIMMQTALLQLYNENKLNNLHTNTR